MKKLLQDLRDEFPHGSIKISPDEGVIYHIGDGGLSVVYTKVGDGVKVSVVIEEGADEIVKEFDSAESGKIIGWMLGQA